MNIDNYKCQFYEYFMKGHDKNKLEEYYFKYNQNPSLFVDYLKKAETRIQTNSKKKSISSNRYPLVKTKTRQRYAKSTKHIKSSRYKCSHCLRFFTTEISFLTHLLINSKQSSQKKIQIVIALKKIKKSLLILKKSNFKYNCSKCKLSFYTKISLGKHLLSHIEYNCDQCDAKFQSKYSLFLHKDVHLRQNELFSPQKFKVNTKKRIVNKNLDSPFGLKCKDCSKIFYDKFSLIKHSLLNHTSNLTNYVCPIDGCCKIFKYKANWLTHVKIHSRAEHIICKYCNQYFQSFWLFNEHVRRNCLNSAQLTCGSCNYKLDENDYHENVAASYIYSFIQKGHFECIDCLTNNVVNTLVG